MRIDSVVERDVSVRFNVAPGDFVSVTIFPGSTNIDQVPKPPPRVGDVNSEKAVSRERGRDDGMPHNQPSSFWPRQNYRAKNPNAEALGST